MDSLNRALALERRRREKFYEELTEDGKFEFINGKVIMHSPAKRKHINVTKNSSSYGLPGGAIKGIWSRPFRRYTRKSARSSVTTQESRISSVIRTRQASARSI